MDYALAAQSTLALSLLVILFAAGCFDVWAMSRYDGHYTISSMLQGWAAHYPILPLSVGLLLGHLFWPAGPTTVP